MTRHFVTGTELTAGELRSLLDRALALKAEPLGSRVLESRTVALLFEKPSTRTRVSFQAGIFELGGLPMVLGSDDLQLARGESVRDTALVLSRHVAAIGVRTGPDALVEELAAHAASASAKSSARSRPAGGTARPWKRFQVSTRTSA